MKILLTGGTGFIGSAVLARLVAADHRVTAVVRSQQSSLKVEAAGATGVIGDLFDPQWLAAELANHDAAIHTASPGDDTSAAMDDAVIAAIIEAFGGTPKPYVHTGGIWTYGDNDAITETSPADPPALTAWRGEREQRILDSGVNATVLAPAVVYSHGAGLPNLLVQGPRTDEGALVLIGGGEQHWTTVHVDDLADLFALALDQQEGGTVVAAGGDNPTVRELGEAVSDLVAAEDPDATRNRLGTPLADALLLDQQASGTSARDRFGWSPSQPSLVQQLKAGYAEGA